MLVGTLNREFLAHNAVRSYPLAGDATKRPKMGGDFALPDNLLVAMRLAISASPSEIDVNGFYISRLTVYPEGANLVISYGGSPVGTASLSADTSYTTFPVIGLNDFHGLAGHITLGSFDRSCCWVGDYQFDHSGTKLDPDVIQYAPNSITSITIVTPTRTRRITSGDVCIIGGDKISITITDDDHCPSGPGGTGGPGTGGDDGERDTVVVISRQNDDTGGRGCIRLINGVGPDEDGNIDITPVTPCLKLEKEPGGITINEVCCDPCCGCEELKAITQSIAEIQQGNADIRQYQERMDREMQQLITNLNITGI